MYVHVSVWAYVKLCVGMCGSICVRGHVGKHLCAQHVGMGVWWVYGYEQVCRWVGVEGWESGEVWWWVCGGLLAGE